MNMKALACNMQFLASYVFLSAAILLTPAVHAQNFAKIGDTCQLTQVSAVCASLAKLSSKPSSGLFAAVAVSQSSLAAGLAHGQISKSAAEQLALANCHAMGANDCQVTDSIQDSCIGYATIVTMKNSKPLTFVGFGLSPDRASAALQAVANCNAVSSAQCVLFAAPCARDNPAFSAPLPVPAGGQSGTVDPNWIGAWQIFPYGPTGGRWVMLIGGNGTYEVHSEALDGTPSNIGTFNALGGRYSLRAFNIAYDDSGTYLFRPPGTMVATGKLGTGIWLRIAMDDE
jgi:hypothetical protein